MWKTPRIGLFIGAQSVQAFDLRQNASAGSFATVAKALEPLQGSRARLDVVLSDAHCRYLVMPRLEGIRNRAELAAAVQSRFRAAFGEVDTWQLRHEATPFGTHDFVAAAQGTLLKNLEDRAQACGLRVASVRPHWVAWARHFRRRTRRGNHWIIGTDGAWISLGYVSDGHCRQARALRLDASRPPLEDLLARERAFIDQVDPAAPVWLGGSELTMPSPLANGAAVTTAAPGALWGLAENGGA